MYFPVLLSSGKKILFYNLLVDQHGERGTTSIMLCVSIERNSTTINIFHDTVEFLVGYTFS